MILAPAALERMRTTRATVEAAFACGDCAFGLTAAGALKRGTVEGAY